MGFKGALIEFKRLLQVQDSVYYLINLVALDNYLRTDLSYLAYTGMPRERFPYRLNMLLKLVRIHETF